MTYVPNTFFSSNMSINNNAITEEEKSRNTFTLDPPTPARETT